ncbi:STAS domain-containing protein [Baaleninema sp.]|uniref:STAS domain-containing protein n=1 Tax=Baaleninema sp. TaxID=3101197 RepID=UPI003D04BB94
MAIVLRPHGKLDARGAAKLRRKLRSLVASSPKTQNTWIVDLSDVRAIDRNGLTSLVALRRCASKAGCQLILRDPSETARAMLEVAHLESSFEIRQSTNKSTKKKIAPPTKLPKPQTLAKVSPPSIDRSSSPVSVSQPASLESRNSYSIELET